VVTRAVGMTVITSAMGMTVVACTVIVFLFIVEVVVKVVIVEFRGQQTLHLVVGVVVVRVSTATTVGMPVGNPCMGMPVISITMAMAEDEYSNEVDEKAEDGDDEQPLVLDMRRVESSFDSL